MFHDFWNKRHGPIMQPRSGADARANNDRDWDLLPLLLGVLAGTTSRKPLAIANLGAAQQQEEQSATAASKSPTPPKGLAYPTVQTFFTDLIKQEPQRGAALHCLSLTLQEEDIDKINDLHDFTVDMLRKEPFHLSYGNAMFVVREVHQALERIVELGPVVEETSN